MRRPLLIEIPEAEQLVAAWRAQYDPSAAVGIPAHVTVLYPFLDRELIDDGIRRELLTLFAARRAFDLQLAECRHFPEVLYLAPEPAGPLRELTGAVVSRWPEAPPFGGEFADVVPHLTAAHCQDPDVLTTVEADLRDQLPVTAHVGAVQLMVFDGRSWLKEQSFPLRAR